MTDEAFEKRNVKGLELQITTIPILPGKQGSVRIKSSSSKKSNNTQKKKKQNNKSQK